MAGSLERKLPTTRLSSLLVGLSTDPQPTSPRSPRSFDGGPVGLRIVAAMSGDPPARSEPVPIVSARPTAMWGKPNSREELELSESYTCVISQAGGKPATKRVYFNGGDRGEQFEPPMPARLALPQPALAGFLSRCYLCRKVLHGLDIFMYRGDQAFCSVECRFHQILNDERMEMCGSEAMKDPSMSPCSAPLLFAVGVAAA